MADNRCVCCGEIIPEGMIACPNCLVASRGMPDDEIENEDEVMDSIFKYLKAEQQAEAEGKKEFMCPLCGGKAWWLRSGFNGHRHSRCTRCGFYVGE